VFFFVKIINLTNDKEGDIKLEREVQKFNVPIYFNKCKTKKSNWFLNLNNYTQASKNTSYRNSLKQKYHAIIKPVVSQLQPIKGRVKITYTVYRHNHTKFDIGNAGAIIDKFTSDCLVDCGIIEDDNYSIVNSVEYIWGGVDRDNPRCEIELIPLDLIR
jgi:hypothetical protein